MDRPSRLFQRRSDRVQIVRIDQFQADRLIRGIALEIDKCMVPRIAAHLGLVAAEIRRVALARDQLQPDDVGGEADRPVQVLRAEPRIADVMQVDHREVLLWRMGVLPVLAESASSGSTSCSNTTSPAAAIRSAPTGDAWVLGIAPQLVLVGVRQAHGLGQQMDPVHHADRAATLQCHGIAVTGMEDGRQRVRAGSRHRPQRLAVRARQFAGPGAIAEHIWPGMRSG